MLSRYTAADFANRTIPQLTNFAMNPAFDEVHIYIEASTSTDIHQVKRVSECILCTRDGSLGGQQCRLCPLRDAIEKSARSWPTANLFRVMLWKFDQISRILQIFISELQYLSNHQQISCIDSSQVLSLLVHCRCAGCVG